MIDDPLGTKSLASIDADYFRTLLPKTVVGRSALDAAASEIQREIAGVEAEQRRLFPKTSRTSMKGIEVGRDGVDPLAYLSNSTAGGSKAANPWDAVRNTITGYDKLAFSDKDRLYQEFVKQEAVRTGKAESDIRLATTDSSPVEPTRSGADYIIDPLAGLGAGVTGMGKTLVDVVAPDSSVSKSLGTRIDTLNSMQSEVEQNNRKEIQAEIDNYLKEHPDADGLDKFLNEMKATGGNLSVGNVSNLVGGMAAGMGAAGKVAQLTAAGRIAAGASRAAATAAGAGAGLATGSAIEGLTTAGEVRGGVYEQVNSTPLNDPGLLASEDFQKYLGEARGDADPNGPGWSPLQEYNAKRTARERLALDSRAAAAAAGTTAAVLTRFGPEKVFADAAAKRAVQEAVGGTVSTGTKLLDNALVRVPVTSLAEGAAEGVPTVATNVTMQNVDPTRGVLEGAGGDVVMGGLGGVAGEGISTALERATKTAPTLAAAPNPDATPPPVAPATDPAVAAGDRVTTVDTPDGPSYTVRQFDGSVVEIPAGPDAQQQAAELAQQAQDEAESLSQPADGALTPIEMLGTQLVMNTDGTIDYAQNAPRTAEADRFIMQQGSSTPPVTPVVLTPEELAQNAALTPAQTTPLTQPEAEAESLAQYETQQVDRVRDDQRLIGSPEEVLQRANNGEFSQEVTALLQELGTANWLGYNTPWGGVEAALNNDAALDSEPRVRQAAAGLRVALRRNARLDLHNEGVPQEIQARVASTAADAIPTLTDRAVPAQDAPRGSTANSTVQSPAVATPPMNQLPSVPLEQLTLPARSASTLANNVRDLARNPLPDITAIEGAPGLIERKEFFVQQLRDLLAPSGMTVTGSPRGGGIVVRTPAGGVATVAFRDNPGRTRSEVQTTTTGLQAGSSDGSAYYAALNAAAVGAGLPMYNDTLTSVNAARLPINRMKALLQIAGASNISLSKVAKLLALNPSRLGSRAASINDFDSFARTIIGQAEAAFPNAEASDMADRPEDTNFVRGGVLRLNPDGTFDTPVGTMTPAELKQWTRVNTSGEPRYRPATSTRSATRAFGASSYSSMATAALLRSYMEATTPAQRAALIRAARSVTASGATASGEGAVTRPFAFLDIRRPDSNGSGTSDRVQTVRAEADLNRLLQAFGSDKLTQEELNNGLVELAGRLADRRNERNFKNATRSRKRGKAWVLSRLNAELSNGNVSEELVAFTTWLLDQNPALAADLGLSIREGGENAPAGLYNPAGRIISLFAGANNGTAVHEILHHSERMMPQAVRDGIQKAYTTALKKAMKNATFEQQQAILKLIYASTSGDAVAMQDVLQSFNDGTLDYDTHYQLANPSEFWAVNATDLLAKHRGQTGWIGKAKKWLQGMAAKLKDLLKLPNDHALLKGIEAVLNGDGSFQSRQMLAESTDGSATPVFYNINPGTSNPNSAANDQTAPRTREGFDETLSNIQNRVPPVAASPERSLSQALSRKQNTAKGQAARAVDAKLQQIGENFHDHLGPVERLFTDIGDQSPALKAAGERATGAMRKAPGVRDNIMRQMIDDHGGSKMFAAVEEIARTQGLTLEAAVRDVGLWLTAKRAPTANARLLARDTSELERANQLHTQAEAALNTARDTAGTPADTLTRLEQDLVSSAGQLQQATRQLALRAAAINNPKATGIKRHVAGVAGFNNAQAAALIAATEQNIPREMLQNAAEHVYDLNAFRIVTDLESGRASPATVAQFLDKPEIAPLLQQLVDASKPDAAQEQGQANRDEIRQQVMAAVRSNYVPLTGNPQSALYEDAPAGGATQPNTGRTYAMEGRQEGSMPDDGITATMGGLIRSASAAGWMPFQDRVAELYDQMTKAQRDDFGIHRNTRQVTDRSTGSNNAALVRLRGDSEQRYEFTDDKILKALHNETIADTDAALGKIATATRAYAWAATQFAPWFAPRNMVRDFGERADLLLSKELRDDQGNKIPSPAVVKSMLRYGTAGLPKVLNAGLRFVLNGTAGGKSVESRYLRELQDSGALSIYGSRFQQSRLDFIKQLKSAKTSSQKLKALNHYTVELWNRPFDFAAPLASYIAMREKGVAKEQAQAITLDMMNFRKRGTQMKAVGAYLPFAQTAVTGGVNMAKSLTDLRNGKMKPYAVARLTGYVLALSALRSMFMAAAEDDEGGNKLAQLPGYEHENNILIPFDNGVAKIPLPFGLMRLANGLVNNTLSYAGHDKSGSQAFTDMFTGSVIPAFTPLSESPIDGEKYPVQKLIMTLAPPIAKPIIQAGLGMTAFGAPLKNEYADKDKFISDQPKLNTPAAYTAMAQSIRQWTGADVPPEVIREIVKGYPLGVLNYARSIWLENKPLKEEVRKAVFTPYPEAARYFQFKAAQDDAATELKKLERGDTDYDPAKIKWFKDYKKGEQTIQGKISSVTKSKGLSAEAKEERKAELRTKRSAEQNAALYKWRTEILKAEAKRTE